MKLREFLKQTLREYFIITTCITFAIGVLGMNLDPEASFGYEAFFVPFLYGLISLIPALVNYSRKELTMRQTLIRKFFHWASIECLILLFAYLNGILSGTKEVIYFALTVLLIYMSVNLILWFTDRKDADKINQGLRILQDRNYN